ncbi:MAG: hypothetical protein CMC05_09440 [Flavobacteriaceae bacterium]|nr:hypothetical protein [Flavobacteriaceae bacterium]
MFSSSLLSKPDIVPITVLGLLGLFITIEWLGRAGEYAIEKIDFLNKPLRWSFYMLLIILMFVYTGEQQEFIYFQF